MIRKLLLLELNEVPFRVIDNYCASRPDSNLARLLANSVQYTTFTEDSLALDPWISWPTLHRGIPDTAHQILHLGQVLDEADSAYPPLWRSLRDRNLAVGVFGSLHSSAVPENVGSYSFYVPDYFGSESFAHPTSLTSFQELNIAMTRQSARNVTRKLPLAAFARFVVSAPFSGLTWETAIDSASHLVRECFDRSLRIRRRAYQPLLMADMFVHQLEKTQPDFATFYTNHVAAAMHRYWGAAFPQDYAQPLDAEWVHRYSGEIGFAMDKLDLIIGRLVSFIARHPEYVLLAGSSMGQAAIPAEKTFQFLTITQLQKFMRFLGVPEGNWEPRPAMVPCVCVVVGEDYRDQVVKRLNGLQIGDRRFKRDSRPIAPMSYDERERGFFQFYVQFDNFGGAPSATFGDQSFAFSEIGLGMMAHEDGVNCTAQHVPEGSLFVYNASSANVGGSRHESISTLDVAPSVLKFFGFEAPTYMKGARSISLS